MENHTYNKLCKCTKCRNVAALNDIATALENIDKKMSELKLLSPIANEIQAIKNKLK